MYSRYFKNVPKKKCDLKSQHKPQNKKNELFGTSILSRILSYITTWINC